MTDVLTNVFGHYFQILLTLIGRDPNNEDLKREALEIPQILF
jgi:hypothetical protein